MHYDSSRLVDDSMVHFRMDKLLRLERDLAHAIRRLYERGLVSGVGGNDLERVRAAYDHERG